MRAHQDVQVTALSKLLSELHLLQAPRILEAQFLNRILNGTIFNGLEWRGYRNTVLEALLNFLIQMEYNSCKESGPKYDCCTPSLTLPSKKTNKKHETKQTNPHKHINKQKRGT